MIETVVGAIAAPIFEQVWKAGGAVVDDIKKTYSKVEAINRLIEASQQYEQRYAKRHGQIKIMPGLMKEPVPLESVYTAVKLLDDWDKRYFRTEQDLEDAYREAGRRNFQIGSDKRQDGMGIASQERFLMVLGGPGIGKSTFLRKIGAETLKKDGQIGQGLIPVLIELKTLKEEDINLATVIANEFDICGFPAATAFTDKALEQGKLMILLDGLDEVPSQNFNPVIECIEDFVDRYDRNHFVASCRIAAYHSSFKRFTDVTIAEFDDDQIHQFIQHWFSSELDQQEQTADQYWELLSSYDHKATKELAQTPLLLTFLCLVYDREQTFPQTRSTLYGDALNILLKDWAAQKRLERDPIYKGFHPELEKELLAEVAYISFWENQLFFSKVDITDRISAFLSDTLDAPKHLDGEAVLKAIEVQQGILVERATNTYSFSLLTIQEYLTALHISNDWDTLANDMVEQYACDERWREVFLLTAGLLQKGRQKTLWAKLEQTALAKAMTTSKVKALVEWANQLTDTQHQGLGSRASVLYIASASALASARASALASTGARARASARASALASARARASALASASASALASALALASAIDSALAIASDSDSAIDSALALASDSAITGAKAVDILIREQIFRTRNLSQLPQWLEQLSDQIPRSDASSNEWWQWANDLNLAFLTGFDLTKEMINLSYEDAEALRDHLYVTELLIRCKDAATRAPKADWEAVEARLLTLEAPPERVNP
ncbi:MAG: NACHT domain-containing protein [Cyanobacteria bacterium J06638_20]